MNHTDVFEYYMRAFKNITGTIPFVTKAMEQLATLYELEIEKTQREIPKIKYTKTLSWEDAILNGVSTECKKD